MTSFNQSLQEAYDAYKKFLKENSAIENMTPKEYGIYLAKKNKRGKKRRRK